MPTEYDLIFKNATVIDGSGGPRRHVSVAVSGGRIASIGQIPDQAAAAVLDISGKVLAPGFIDPHGHSDLDAAHGAFRHEQDDARRHY